MSAHQYNPVTMLTNDEKDCMDMGDAVKAIEEMLEYKFKDKMLLEMALTHSSYTKSVLKSYQRLEFVGDAALGSMIATYAYIAYPDHDPRDLTLITSANVSTENLARVAIRTGLYQYMRHSVASMDDKVICLLECLHFKF